MGEAMAKDLVVGPASLSHLEKAIAAHLTGLGVKHDLGKWLAAEHGEITICSLNGASVVEFLRHVVRCEGYFDERTGFAAGENGTSKYRNMPWWDDSVWLPIELEPGILEVDAPFFVGSCTALLRELHDLQDISQIQLGSAPRGYEEMRADVRKFYRSIHSSAAFQMTDVDCLRWVWLALRDGADLAINENTVLYAGPD
jgi:hypothetical protein